MLNLCVKSNRVYDDKTTLFMHSYLNQTDYPIKDDVNKTMHDKSTT